MILIAAIILVCVALCTGLWTQSAEPEKVSVGTHMPEINVRIHVLVIIDHRVRTHIARAEQLRMRRKTKNLKDFLREQMTIHSSTQPQDIVKQCRQTAFAQSIFLYSFLSKAMVWCVLGWKRAP